MGTLQIMAAALIQIFDLEDDTDLSVGKRVAGYSVIALICIVMSIHITSYG